ncbi:hypothetical protein E4U13_005283 [Claviceps humidiphila]|uniref:DNA/RNA-binding protein Alba-like domain-containing protein n=1 Tax=Claviceps humidiphila TaxID=1294629 RepID=A0A9P7PWG4_9HYPO|nr:hypothetical protein E4U13_005283 [Claviceps humidiphila]
MPPTEAAHALASSTKRKGKDISDAGHAPNPPKRSKTNPPPQTNSLIGPHETLLSYLRPKYNVLAASVISSTKIGKRVAQITSHLSGESDPNQPPLVLLYARPAEVCKMITIVEQCKRIMQAEGRSWFQYNQMYEVPAREGGVIEKVVENKKKKDKNKNKKETEKLKEKDTEGREVEPDDDEHDDEDEDEDDDEDDAFEAMAGRFEKAVGGASAAKERTVRSLRVVLRSGQAMRDWRDEKGVTMQSSEEAGT